jgi:putative colanic acid biosynthesis acetyltransferase WcaB
LIDIGRNLSASIFQDWLANHKNPKGRLVLLAFRIAQRMRRLQKPWFWLGVPYLLFYRFIIEWILTIELPWNLTLGPGARLFHGFALVINDQVVIGRNVVLRHSTTIGVNATGEFGSKSVPIIGDDVDIGSNVVIVGPIRIGDRARIGAGSVVVHDAPDDSVVVGNPARVIRIGATPNA